MYPILTLADKVLCNKVISSEVKTNDVTTEDVYINNKIYTNNIYTPIIRCVFSFIYNGGVAINNTNDTLTFTYSSPGRYQLTFKNIPPPSHNYYNVVCMGTKNGDETNADRLKYTSFSKTSTSFYIKQFSGSSPENHNSGGWTNIIVSW